MDADVEQSKTCTEQVRLVVKDDEEHDRVDGADKKRVFQSASHTMHGRLRRRHIELTLNVFFIVVVVRASFCSLGDFSLRLCV